MSFNFFTEPLYSFAEFDRLFDEAFNARTSGPNNSALARRDGRQQSSVSRIMRPR